MANLSVVSIYICTYISTAFVLNYECDSKRREATESVKRNDKVLEVWKYALVNPEENIHLPSTPITDWLCLFRAHNK